MLAAEKIQGQRLWFAVEILWKGVETPDIIPREERCARVNISVASSLSVSFVGTNFSNHNYSSRRQNNWSILPGFGVKLLLFDKEWYEFLIRQLWLHWQVAFVFGNFLVYRPKRSYLPLLDRITWGLKHKFSFDYHICISSQ